MHSKKCTLYSTYIRVIETQCCTRRSVSFWCRLGSDFPFRCQFRSGSYPQVLHMLEIRFFSLLFTVSIFIFLVRAKGVRNFLVFWTVNLNFLEKVKFSFTFGWNQYGSGSDEMMPIRIYNTDGKSVIVLVKGTQDWDFFWLRFWNL